MRKSLIFDTFQSWHGHTIPPGPNGPQVILSIQDHHTFQISGKAPFKFNTAPEEDMGRLWGLWNYEVLEVFIYGQEQKYVELEFGPWGHHLALYFNGVRSLQDEYVRPTKVHTWRKESVKYGAQWGFSCSIPKIKLPPPLQGDDSTWGVNAFWCYNNKDSQREFCCAHLLPGTSPDFHQPSYFPKWSFSPSTHKS